jgi:hypothetical protein
LLQKRTTETRTRSLLQSSPARIFDRERNITRMLIRLAKIFALTAVTAAAAAGCADEPAEEFLGTWAFSAGAFQLDCGGQPMILPIEETVTETFELGTGTDLSKSSNNGCAEMTFDVSGRVARLSPAPQTCTIPGMGMSTADSFTITISSDGEAMTFASTGTFLATGAPAACAYTLDGTLARR